MYSVLRRNSASFAAYATATVGRTSTSTSVSVFWDLSRKLPSTSTNISPYDAAVRLHLAASSFGRLRFSVAYATHHAFRHLRPSSKPSPPRLLCRVCGRSFFDRAKLLHHFNHIHKPEHDSRIRRIDSARGRRKVLLASQLSLKMAKYRKAARELFVPDAGTAGLGDELRRAGVVVRTVEDSPEAASRALRQHMRDTVEKGNVGCLILVSDDVWFSGVLREAKERCLRTVVVGEEGDGALKRIADEGLLWKDVVSGKARKKAVSSVGRWNDGDFLRRLEWQYEPENLEEEQVEFPEFEGEIEDEGGLCLDCEGKEDRKPWWKLD